MFHEHLFIFDVPDHLSNNTTLFYERIRLLTLDDAVLDVALAIRHVHRDRPDVWNVLELDAT